MVSKNVIERQRNKNKSPERKPFLLRLPEELIEDLRGWADEELRSMNAQFEVVLREALAERG